ncbi:golgi apyrase [Suhomyces tanzawaensis NRRL Y-17324]|uniref:Golgi apyrase n=1 Tax=Suhomyces tanzawaensis NRRL Y-17324 TaxID=984487 RepID=A0A1E4SBX7_9ASCO|nr:golgi apyrase [Suhomyces tanzawaensis NRRL Y-17324]ODV77001.1 golgi apyrase [Suhomyces tanzawaensis NRRL Y-17324]
MKTEVSTKYGIVIDSGSSGSRIQIYKWEDPAALKASQDSKLLKSPPKIVQERDWTLKTTPGISTFNTPAKVSKIWSDHYSKLIEFAQGIIPASQHGDTPIFILSTAGMRLLSPDKQTAILKETCAVIRQNTNFYLPNCGDYIQIIDGKTEGMYGWLGLNYLMGQFDEYDLSAEKHESIGFMDMGGASSQIAFVPSSKEELEKHNEDLSLVTLRNINGDTQKWNVFVETWLGFGANEARNRFLKSLISLASYENDNAKDINDPCLPKGASFEYTYMDKKYNIKGLGNYEMCLKNTYPLLMKNIPCESEPCLFNGVHGPKMNFDADKFVGISEYWYTANDIFQSGGEYNYHKFNEKVKEYCESDWSQILENSKEGKYSGLDPNTFLRDACFKANWVLNVLHEGFELPRLGLEVPDNGATPDDVLNEHVPFKSTDSVNGEELSWTLGKILLFASSQIDAEGSSGDSLEVGIFPSEISGKPFIPGGGSLKNYSSDDDSDNEGNSSSFGILSVLLFFILLLALYQLRSINWDKYNYKFKRLTAPVRNFAFAVGSRIPIVDKFAHKYEEINLQNDVNINLEEGLMSSLSTSPKLQQTSVLRTRLNINLNDGDGDSEYLQLPPIPRSFSSLNTPNGFTNFNKPFVVPKRNASFYHSENTSRESFRKS